MTKQTQVQEWEGKVHPQDIETIEDAFRAIQYAMMDKMHSGNGLVPQSWLRDVDIYQTIRQVETDWKETKKGR